MKIPRLASQRLTLRPYEQRDFEEFAALTADADVRRHTGGPLSRDQAARRFERFVTGECSPGNEVWAITCQESGRYVGHCWFVREGTGAPEMGFLVAARDWGQGYGTEVAQTLLDYARGEAGYPRVVATVDCDHVASIRVLERVGMQRESTDEDDEGPHFVYSIGVD